jgi:DNA-directed RNA polymerase sigma subunit (sigma70/sigma32)
MGAKAKPDRDKILTLLGKNVKPTEIANILGVPVTRVRNVQARARRAGELAKPTDITKDIENYEPQLINNIKSISLEVSNTLLNKSFQKESSTQLAKTLGILIDKLRLIESHYKHA